MSMCMKSSVATNLSNLELSNLHCLAGIKQTSTVYWEFMRIFRQQQEFFLTLEFAHFPLQSCLQCQSVFKLININAYGILTRILVKEQLQFYWCNVHGVFTLLINTNEHSNQHHANMLSNCNKPGMCVSHTKKSNIAPLATLEIAQISNICL